MQSDRALIAEAQRRTLYTNLAGSLAILEDAVRRNPQEIVYSVEYIHALSIYSDKSFADRASRYALKLHPHNPDLLIAAPVYSVATSTVALPWKHWPSWLRFPVIRRKRNGSTALQPARFAYPRANLGQLRHFTTLADRLLVIGRADDAARYIDEALNTVVGEPARPLLARRAMLAALKGEFDRAMKLHASAGGDQVVMEDSYYGLADVLLAKNRPDLAIISFGAHAPTDENSRRVLAMARSRSNDTEGAMRLLGGGAMEDRLLRCRVLLRQGGCATQRRLGRKIVAPMEILSGSNSGPWIGGTGPRSLLDGYLAVLRWLNEQFPEKRLAIELVLGTGTEDLPIAPSDWSPDELTSRMIARLEATMRKRMVASDLASVRASLAQAYADAGRYDDAAALVITSSPLRAGAARSGSINYRWVEWSMLRRQAEPWLQARKTTSHSLPRGRSW